MAKINLDAVLAPDRQSATLVIKAADATATSFHLDADDIAQIINLLGITRASMVGAAPAQADGSLCTLNPASSARITADGMLLSFRHAAFGWCGFLLPQASIASLQIILANYLGLGGPNALPAGKPSSDTPTIFVRSTPEAAPGPVE